MTAAHLDIEGSSNMETSDSAGIRHIRSLDVYDRPPAMPCLYPAATVVHLFPEAEASRVAELDQACRRLQAIPRASPVPPGTALTAADLTRILSLAIPSRRGYCSSLVRNLKRRAQDLFGREAMDHAHSYQVRKGTPSRVSHAHVGSLNPLLHKQRIRRFIYITAASTLGSKGSTFRYEVVHHSDSSDIQKVRAMKMPLPSAKDQQWNTPYAAPVDCVRRRVHKKFLRHRKSQLSEVMNMRDVEALEAAWDPFVE